MEGGGGKGCVGRKTAIRHCACINLRVFLCCLSTLPLTPFSRGHLAAKRKMKQACSEPWKVPPPPSLGLLDNTDPPLPIPMAADIKMPKAHNMQCVCGGTTCALYSGSSIATLITTRIRNTHMPLNPPKGLFFLVLTSSSAQHHHRCTA